MYLKQVTVFVCRFYVSKLEKKGDGLEEHIPKSFNIFKNHNGDGVSIILNNRWYYSETVMCLKLDKMDEKLF